MHITIFILNLLNDFESEAKSFQKHHDLISIMIIICMYIYLMNELILFSQFH